MCYSISTNHCSFKSVLPSDFEIPKPARLKLINESMHLQVLFPPAHALRIGSELATLWTCTLTLSTISFVRTSCGDRRRASWREPGLEHRLDMWRVYHGNQSCLSTAAVLVANDNDCSARAVRLGRRVERNVGETHCAQYSGYA